MNWVDVVILATFAWFTYAAFHAGAIREIVTIVGAVFAVALAGLFYEDLAEDIKVAVDDVETARIIAFGTIFGATVLASQLAALFLRQAASLLLLGIFDSIAGAVIGMVKSFVFVEMGLVVAITFTSLGLEGAINDSALSPFFLDFLQVLKHILPAEFKTAISGF